VELKPEPFTIVKQEPEPGPLALLCLAAAVAPAHSPHVRTPRHGLKDRPVHGVNAAGQGGGAVLSYY
jgi:hypothetical protein